MSLKRTRKHAGRMTGVIVLLACMVLLPARGVWGAVISHIGTGQRVLVICVKWSNHANTRMATAADWVNLLNRETNQYYNRATFNQTNFVFEAPSGAGAPADGWFSLGYSSANYDFGRTGQDAIRLVDPYVDFSRYHRVLVINNHPDFGGQGTVGFWWWRTGEGVERNFVEDGVTVGKRLMSLAHVNEWVAGGPAFDWAGSVAAHELGHSLEVPTHYGDVRWHPGMTRECISPWDIMGWSPGLNHFLGWPKAQRQWVPAGRVQTVGPPRGADIDTTIALDPLEYAGTGTQVIKIPFTSEGPFLGYIVENRRKVSGDENLPSEGVLLSLVDESPSVIVKCLVLEDPGSPGNLDQAPLEVGDSFEDTGRLLTVTVVSQSHHRYNVRIQYRLPPHARPDPMIIPWGAPPWETADMWIDSEKNGWDTYRYADSAGNPVGNGDDAWVNRDNRVYVRVRNIGPGEATNVRVQVFLNDPPGMGDRGADWRYLGTILFPSISSGGTAQDWVPWKPTVGAHSCIKAQIERVPGELSESNNGAQENVTHFDTTPGSPYQPVEIRIRVNNPFEKEKTPVYFHVRDIPDGWAAQVVPTRMMLTEGGYDWVSFKVFPSGTPGAAFPPTQLPQYPQYRPGFIGKPRIEALAPYGDTFIPLGGVDVWTHLVNPTKLGCSVTQSLVQAAHQQFIISGKLEPAIGGARIAVELTTAEKREVRLATTGSDGAYRVSFVPPVGGTWRAQAFFGGDMNYAPADSNVCEFAAAVAPVPPAAPTELSASALSPAQVLLSWKDNAANEAGYKVERKVEGGSYGQVATVGPDAVSYKDSGLSAGTTYSYRVRAYNSAGDSAYSNEARVTTPVSVTVRIIKLYIGSVNYLVDGKPTEMDTTPIIRESRTLLPVRFIAEPLGAQVEWDAAERKVTIRLKGRLVELWVDNPVARVDGVERPVDPNNPAVKPIVVPPGRTMVPVRFVAESLDCRVDWDGATQEVKITYPQP